MFPSPTILRSTRSLVLGLLGSKPCFRTLMDVEDVGRRGNLTPRADASHLDARITLEGGRRLLPFQLGFVLVDSTNACDTLVIRDILSRIRVRFVVAVVNDIQIQVLVYQVRLLRIGLPSLSLRTLPFLSLSTGVKSPLRIHVPILKSGHWGMLGPGPYIMSPDLRFSP